MWAGLAALWLSLVVGVAAGAAQADANTLALSLGALQLQTEIQPLATINYAYDDLGRLSSRQIGGAGPETFGYDNLSRLTTHASDLGSFTLGYNGESGQITSRAATNISTAWVYQPNAEDRRLQSVTTTWGPSGQSTGFTYITNAQNQITHTTQTSDAAIALPPGALTQTAVYSTNPLNQLDTLTTQGAAATLTWDADGNLTSDATRTYGWNAENRLVSVGYTGQPSTVMTYDGLGRRTSITNTVGGVTSTTNYIWCGDQLCQAQNSAGKVIRAYYAEGEFVPGAPSKSYDYAPDNLGAVRRVFATRQSSPYDYDSYGNLLQTGAPVTDYTWAGMFHEPQSGLYLTNNRPYDPVTGRFLTRDPIGEDADPQGNLYPYAANDPVNANDPLGLAASDGLSPEEPPGSAVAVGGNADPGSAGEGGSSLPVVFNGEFATLQLLGTTTTPSGRQIMFHAADRMVNPPAGRAAMSPAEVDQVLEGATKIDKMSYNPQGDTLTIRNENMPGSPRVIVDAATGQKIITVINPKSKVNPKSKCP